MILSLCVAFVDMAYLNFWSIDYMGPQVLKINRLDNVTAHSLASSAKSSSSSPRFSCSNIIGLMYLFALLFFSSLNLFGSLSLSECKLLL